MSLYVNAIQASTTADTFYARGCMQSSDSGASMPLSLRAVYEPTDNTFEVTIFSTYVPAQEGAEPFVIRLRGVVEIRGDGVSDDSASGDATTEFTTGAWSGTHRDRRNSKCPPVPGSFGVHGDVYAHQDLAPQGEGSSVLYEVWTIVVSAGVRVTAPDGSTTIIQEYTDLYSPDVDFIGYFRYLANFPGAPAEGGLYQFVLVDAFGDPIAGTESTDTWWGCDQAAPLNITAEIGLGNDVTVAWDPVPDVPGEFEPGGDPYIGYYQLDVAPYEWEGSSSFGAITQTQSHVVPWDPFVPGSAGDPEGWDFGVALSDFENGRYLVSVAAYSEPSPSTGGFGHECAVNDSSANLLITKQGDDLTIGRPGPLPFVNVQPDHGWAHSGNWVPGAVVTLSFGEYQTSQSADGDGNVFFDLFGSGIAPGVTVSVTDGIQTRSLLVASVTFDGVDDAPNTAWGTAPAGAHFRVAVADNGGDYWVEADADESGTWFVLFGEDFGPVTDAWVQVFDDDGDSTVAHLPSPPPPAFVNVQPDHGWAHSGNWAPGTAVTLSLLEHDATEIADVDGSVFFDLTGSGVTPGVTVSVTDGIQMKDLLVALATFDGVDDTSNTAWGRAPGEAHIGVGIRDEGGVFYWLEADASLDGNWSVDFDDHGQDFGPVTDAWVHVFDDDGDSTLAHLPVPLDLAR